MDNSSGQRSFHAMRYVVALLGSVALALMSLIQRVESQAMWLWLQYYDIPSIGMYVHILNAFSILILALTGIFFKKLSAKWIMIGVMSAYALLALLYTTLYNRDLVFPLAILSCITTLASPGICFVAMHAIISKWSPPNERSLITSIVYFGVGTATIYTIASDFQPPEYTALYVGISCLIWILLWFFLVEDTPENSRFTSVDEKSYIRFSIETYQPQSDQTKDVSVWRVIFSKVFFSIVLIEGSNTLIEAILIYFMPLSLGIYVLELKEHIIKAVVILVTGILTAACLQWKLVSFSVSRKIPSVIATVVPVALMIGPFGQSKLSVHKVCNIIGNIITGAEYSGARVNMIDISPKHAPLLLSIVMIIKTIFSTVTGVSVIFIHENYELFLNLLVLPPITVFVGVSAILYWFWGSSAQRTTNATVENAKMGQIHSMVVRESAGV